MTYTFRQEKKALTTEGAHSEKAPNAEAPGLSHHSSKKRIIQSTQNLSPILEIRDGIIISKARRFYKMIEIEPVNFELQSSEEQAAIIDQFSAVIRTWPNLIHLKVVSTRSDIEPYIKNLERRRKQEKDSGSDCCADLIEDQIELIKKVNQVQGVSWRFFLTFSFEAESGFKRRPPFEEIVQSLNREARSIAANMEGCGNRVIILEDRDAILEALYLMQCRSQAGIIPFEERKATIISRYRDKVGESLEENMIPANDFFCPDKIDSSLSPQYILIDGMYVAYCFLPASAYPVQAYGGWLQILFGHLDGVDVDFWIQKEDASRIHRKLTFALRKNKLRAYEKSDISQDYDDLMSSIRSGYYIKNALAAGDDLCYISTIVTIMANSEEDLRARFQEMRDHCIRNDMTLRRCVFQQEDAYRSCFPLAEYCPSLFDKSKRNVMASQLGSSYPFTVYELADKGGIFMGVNSRYGSPVFLNPFDTDKYQSANMIVLGPSGSGKTYTLLCMLLRMRQEGHQVFVIAPLKGHEFRRSCKAIGGEYIRIAPGSNQNINVMEIRPRVHSVYDTVHDPGPKEEGSVLSTKIQQLHRFFSLLLPNMTETETQILDEVLKSVYSQFGITEENDSLTDPKTGSPRVMPTLADVHKALNGCGAEGRRIYNSLTRYVTGSARSFSLPTNVDLKNRYIVIDVSDLTAAMLPVGMFIALDYVMDQAKQDITQRKIIAVDEMWRLMKASRQSAEFVQQIYKEIRGYGGAAIGATQDLSDVLSDDIGSAIINNARFKVVLPMDKKEVELLSRVIDISEAIKSQLKQTSLKAGGGGTRKALLVVNNNQTFINIRASRTEHDLITTNAADLRRIAARSSENADGGRQWNADDS